MPEKQLYVHINNKFVGVLKSDNQEGLAFEYDKNATTSLSLSLPLEQKKFTNSECCGFFNGLLPENEETKKRIALKYGINPNNDFSMLQAIGYDCPGAVSFWEDESLKNLKEYYDINAKAIEDEDLEKFIKELPKKPLGMGASDLRLSLAGAQDKTAVVLIDNKICIPDNYTPTTHILKPAIKALKETVENEYICMKTAQKCGIRVPKVEIRQTGKTKYFLIERFDRIIENGKIKRLHQEDFCQASNIMSAYKYENDGGLGFKSCFDILKKTKKPIVYINEFINLMIFNYLIMNNDAHGKNFSILHNEDGSIDFAPAYDLLCTKVYSKLSHKMAMSVGGRFSCQEIYPSDFEALAHEVGISYAQLAKLIIKYCDILPSMMEEVVGTFENKIGTMMLSLVRENCLKNLKRFKKT